MNGVISKICILGMEDMDNGDNLSKHSLGIPQVIKHCHGIEIYYLIYLFLNCNKKIYNYFQDME